MIDDEAVVLLNELDRTRDRTRFRLAELFWLPWLLYGSLSLAALPVTWWFGERSLGLFWALAVPAAAGVIARHHRRVELRLGLEAWIAPTLVGAGVIAVGAFGTGVAGDVLGWPMLSATGPALSVAAGLSVFAVVQRNPDLVVAALVISGSVGAVLVSRPAPPTATAVLLVVCGLVGITVGISCRRSARLSS